MVKVWHDLAWCDYEYWQKTDKKILKKTNNLIKDIERNGYKCFGKPEPLKGIFSGWWSVRIDEKNRLLFKLEKDTFKIYSCKGHYE